MRTYQLLFASLLSSFTSALNPILVESQDFVDSVTGTRFEIIGVDYQPGGESGYDPESNSDVLSQPAACLRDAALMQSLGINTIRIYNLDPYINHDQCVSIFNDVGIYLLIDVNAPQPGDSINQADPGPSYDLSYLNRTFAVLDAFRNYPNLIGFFSANEVINDWTTAGMDPPYLRAVTRDLKQYIAARGGRSIPIGYSAADFRPALVDTSNYLQCNITSETDVSSRSDFFALNSYSWCGDSSFTTSTYNQLAADFAATTVPVFFSEYGCNNPFPRTFTEVPVLYGPLMTTWSGGLVYQWTNEVPNFGLIAVQTDGSVALSQDYVNLQGQYASLNFTLIETQNATARTLVAPTCNKDLIADPQFDNSFSLPAPPPGAAQLISQGVVGAVTGGIVPVTATTANLVVTSVGGATTSGLTITHVSSANTPGATATGKKKNAAVGRAGGMAGPVAGTLFAVFALWLMV